MRGGNLVEVRGGTWGLDENKLLSGLVQMGVVLQLQTLPDEAIFYFGLTNL